MCFFYYLSLVKQDCVWEAINPGDASRSGMQTNSLTSTTSVPVKHGWTASPDGRGTMSIVWSCAITTLLCCWSVLVINVPSPNSSYWSIVARKLMLLCLCATAPEIIFQVALGQWLLARESVKVFHASGYDDWSLRHGFFVNMGGFHLRSPDYPPFPINSRQLHYLIEQNHVCYPQIEEDQIRDRNKVDGVLRLITLVQTLFFVANSLTRIFQQLTITALELSTLAFVVMSIATTAFWFRKPADVQERIFLDTDTPIATILANFHGPSSAVYSYTPLDIIGREEWSWSIMWMHGLNSLRKLHLGGQPVELPNDRFHNTTVPIIKGWPHTFFALLSLAYLSIFIAGWNFDFPTATEQTLWRSASITALTSASSVFISHQIFFKYFPVRHSDSNHENASVNHINHSSDDSCKLHKVLDRVKAAYNFSTGYLRNNSSNQDPALNAPGRAVIVTGIFGFFYVSARVYMFLADIIELRSLPASAYKSVDWASLAPYIP